ncbi:MAG: hypothetical protein HDR13_13880 [Lachnospiraceae bacterium]|nr:hypothetical protein [Lachnospiraceae bacterium]
MKKVALLLLSTLGGAAVAAVAVKKVIGDAAEVQHNMSEKHLALFLMMNQWVKVKQEGKHLADYLEQKGYKSIAIYGMSYAGERLLEELKGSNIEVRYGIDRNAETIYSDIDLVTNEDRLEPVDAIIITSIFFFDEIEKQLSEKVDYPIISLEDILYEV